LLHIEEEKREAVVRELARVAGECYVFLDQHRSVIPFILRLLNSKLSSLRLVAPLLAVFFAFPVDRLRDLRVDSPAAVLAKLRA
jgi:hypothetical protein